jgi:hypothetical protein
MDETIEEREGEGRLTLTSHECTIQVYTHQVKVVIVSTLPYHTTVCECGIFFALDEHLNLPSMVQFSGITSGGATGSLLRGCAQGLEHDVQLSELNVHTCQGRYLSRRPICFSPTKPVLRLQ